MQAARATRSQQASTTRSVRPQLHLVGDNSAKITKRKVNAANEKTARSLFVASVLFIAALVIIGFGPVMINAEATRSSQQSIILKDDITRATTVTQNLQLQRSALRSASTIEKIAREQMDMVPVGKNFIAIEIGSDKGVDKVQTASAQQSSDKASSNNVLKDIARLTSGEASALLVGDISLATIR